MKSSKQGNAFWRRLVLRTLCLLIPATSGFAADPPKLTEEGFRQLGVIMAEKAARTPAQKKMDSQLVHGARIARGQRLEGLPDYKPDLKVRADGRVLVDIDAIVTDALLAQIKAGGGQIIASVPNLRAIQALVSPVQAEALAGRADVSFIRPAVEAKTNTVTSQGDVAHGANTFRTRTLADGTGIRVGVLSDSVDYLSTSQSNGELGTVTVLSGQGGPTASGEGTAMLEIVHDLAPAHNCSSPPRASPPPRQATRRSSRRIFAPCERQAATSSLTTRSTPTTRRFRMARLRRQSMTSPPRGRFIFLPREISATRTTEAPALGKEIFPVAVPKLSME